jgi:tRNA (cmo5U34)-methyltransferase
MTARDPRAPLAGAAPHLQTRLDMNKPNESPLNAAPATEQDEVFADPNMSVTDFRFDATVAAAFDDMVSRSVPYYDEIQRMVVELATDFAEPGSRIYDLGCSTATTLALLDRTVHPEVHFVGIDNSQEMLAKARAKLDALAPNRRVDLVCQDMHDGLQIEDASVVMLLLTLQFVRPLYRERIVRRIAEGMRRNGALILVEKLVVTDSRINRLYIEHYYGYKRRNGYSDVEITNKREALENVLVPYRYEENRELLLNNGFGTVEEFFRWYNFSALVAIRN